MEIKTGSDIAKISMDDIIDFMRTRPHSEIVTFQNTAQALIEQYGNIAEVTIKVREPNVTINGRIDYVEVELTRKA